MLRPRDRVTLAIEKPAAGGWMIARHEGQVVLVAGAIPGERVVADITRAGRSVAYATAIDILEPGPIAGRGRATGRAVARATPSSGMRGSLP